MKRNETGTKLGLTITETVENAVLAEQNKNVIFLVDENATLVEWIRTKMSSFLAGTVQGQVNTHTILW